MASLKWFHLSLALFVGQSWRFLLQNRQIKRLHGPDNFVLTVLMRGETMNPFGLETHFGANQPIFCATISTVVTTASEDQLGSFSDHEV